MAFKKAKTTFLHKAGRRGAPTARKPFAKNNTKKTLGKMAANTGKKANTRKARKLVVKNGAPMKTSAVKKNVNSLTGRSASSFPLGSLALNARLSNFFSGKAPKGRFAKSANGNPQSVSNTVKPRG